MKTNWLHFLWGCAALALISAALTGCGQSQRAQAVAPESTLPVVRFLSVETQLVTDSIDLAAKVQPDPTKVIHIYPPASGRVLGVLVKPGDAVRRGQTLATIQSSDVAGAHADYEKARIENDRSSRTMEREKSLLDHGAAAEKDYLDAKAAAASAQTELARAEQRLRLLRVTPNGTSDLVPLPSPTDGVVLDVAAAPGEFAKSLESSTALLTIANLDPIWVMGDAYEKDVSKLSLGKIVIVRLPAYPGQEWKARIAAISDALDPATRTLKIRVSLPNPKRMLKPEMFASIHVETGSHQGVLVPATAVIREGDSAFVYVQEAGGKVARRPVQLGANLNGNIEIVAGLRAGESVAGEGVELLRGSEQEQ